MEEHGCEFQLDHLEQFLLENKEPLEEIVKEFEKHYPESKDLFNSEFQQGTKCQSWLPSSQEEWDGGFPVNLKPITQNDMEHFLRVTHACQGKEEFNVQQQLHNVLHENNQIDDNFDNESLADSCLFFSNDGNKIFTCSFPEFSSPRGSVLGKVSHHDAPLYYEETPYIHKERNLIKEEPQKLPQEIFLSSAVMRGSFKPRYPDPSLHYASGLSDVTLQEVTQNHNQPTPHFIGENQQLNNFFSKENVLTKQDEVLSQYSSHRKEGTRKRTRPPSPHGQPKQQLQVQPFPNDDNNHLNGDAKESFEHTSSSNPPKHFINKVCTLSPQTFSSDTIFGASSGESNSPGKSSLTSPEQVDDVELRSNVEWTPFRSKSSCKLFGADRKEVRFLNVQLNVDKGINYSPMDDSFVCQRKNHFQVTFSFCLSHQPKFIEVENSFVPLSSIHLHFYGIKAESESHVVSIEQSESDRSKHHYQPVQIKLSEVRPNVPVKVVVGRLHFGETTLNNMRKRGKPNPDQRFFRLVASLGSNVADGTNLNNMVEPRYPLLSYVSEKIIVRASNPNQFENDPESLWIKGKSGDSICHYGNVGINTKSPTEALTVHGSVKITGQLLEPSDARVKTDIKEVSTKVQLQNINLINMYQYRYLPSYEEYAGLRNTHKYIDGSSPTDVPKVGILAQQVSQILPDAVQVVGDVVLPDGRVLEGFLVVNKERIFMEGIGAVKELSKVTQNLECRINKIELKNKDVTKFNNKTTKSVVSPQKEMELDSSNLESHPGQSGHEKLSSLFVTLYRKRWKTIALVTAISIALICSIIGMVLGIKGASAKNPPPTVKTTTKRPECIKILGWVKSESPLSECPRKDSMPIFTHNGATCPSGTTDTPSSVAPTANDSEYSSVANIETTVLQYTVTPDDGTTFDNGNKSDIDITSDSGSQTRSYSNQPLFLTTLSGTFDSLENNSTNSTRVKRGLNVMKREEDTSQKDADSATDFSITRMTLPELNLSLCTDTNFNFSLSKDFPKINVLIQFSLNSGKDIDLCGWDSIPWNNGKNETSSPCFKEESNDMYTWNLPIGFYKDLIFKFLVFNKNHINDNPCKANEDPNFGKFHYVSFSRICQ